ncbi:MAG: hypothetical protein KAS53_10205 [Candidatus Cloacimonetes bacterium]|nr:hypothetical protein [Candidatus Cloacimonadota bacterium]
MKRLFILSLIMSVAYIIAGCTNTTSVDDLTKYKVIIINDSSSEITNIEIEMIGVDNSISIESLTAGESTSELEFLLPLPGDDVPFSHGDFQGSYLQESIEKYFAVIQPELSITILIDDDSFSYE